MLRSNTSCLTARRTVPPLLGSSFPAFWRPLVPLRGRPGSPPLLSSPFVVPPSSSLRGRCLLLSSSSPSMTDIIHPSSVAPRLVCSSAKISSSSGSSSSTPQQDNHDKESSSASHVSVFSITLFSDLVVEACFPSSSPSSLSPSTNRAGVMKDFLKDDHRHRSQVVKKIRNILTQQLLPKHGEASIDDFAFAASETLKQVSLSNEKMKTHVRNCFIDGFRIPSKVAKKHASKAAARDPPVDLYRKRLAKELLPHLRVVWDFCLKEDKKIFPSDGN